MRRAWERVRALAARVHRPARKTVPAGPVPVSRFRLVLVGISLAVLSAITGVISYSHGLDVARWVGNVGLVAYLVPLVPDLMIVTSSLTLIEASAVKAPRPLVAMLALLVGIGWTVAQNIAAGWRNGPGGAVLAAGIPLAFVFTFESLLWLVRRGRGGTSLPPAPATQPVLERVPADVQSAALAALQATTAAGNPLSGRQLETRFGLSRAEATRVRELAEPIDVAGAPESVSTGASRPLQSALNGHGNGGAS